MSKPRRRFEHHIDYTLLLVIIALVAFGLVMLYSTSAYTSNLKYGDAYYYLRKQAIACGIGFALMLVVVVVDYRRWAKLYMVGYLLSFVLCVAVIFLGSEGNGSTRWFKFGAFSFQPSEFAKVAIILFYAVFLSHHVKALHSWKAMFLTLAMCAPVFIAVAVNNLSTAATIAGIAYVMVFVAYKGYIASLIPIVGLVAGGYVGISTVAYRAERIQAWLHPENYSNGYQTLQGLYAIGTGGLFGKGLGESVQKLGYVPEAQNDMIFSIICEELGIAGGVAVVLMFLALLWRLLQIATKARTLMGSYIAIGIMAHIAIQVILNIAVVTNSIPNTGVVLPFISYGGSSVMFLLAELGLALSVSRDLKPEED